MYPLICYSIRFIVVFRDGVGDGQLAAVQKDEVASMTRVLENLQCGATFCYVIVSKRIMQRFFAVGRNGQPENPPPGE